MKVNNERTLVIAEAGVNHNGSIQMARELVDAAADAGADLIKFQTFDATQVTVEGAAKADYQKKTTHIEESQLDMLRSLELPSGAFKELVSHCDSRGIGFFSTAFDHTSLQMLMDLGANRIKVPSGEITNLFFLRFAASLGKPLIVSTGMSSLGDIEAALDVLLGAGVEREKITVLHCNTEYPTPMADVNLDAMLAIRDAFKVKVGYSDHTQGITVPVAAVALGASIIEKHLTLDRSLAGPDHGASLEPEEFKKMVKSIREVELAKGDGVKRVSNSEAKNKNIVRRSLVASKAISLGEPLTEDNVTAKRPGHGICPMRWNEVCGRHAERAFQKDECIEI